MAELKDSGTRREFTSGAQRDRGAGKPRLVLIPSWATFAYGWIMEAGAIKYSARNWEKGMPISEYLESAKRHIDYYIAGKRDEPHLWQAFWNIGCAIHTQIFVYIGAYPQEFYDLPNHIGIGQAPILSAFEKSRVDSLLENEEKNENLPSVNVQLERVHEVESGGTKCGGDRSDFDVANGAA